MNFEEKLIEYYNSDYEKKRITMDNAHRIEYITTLHYFDKLLPKSSKILD